MGIESGTSPALVLLCRVVTFDVLATLVPFRTFVLTVTFESFVAMVPFRFVFLLDGVDGCVINFG